MPVTPTVRVEDRRALDRYLKTLDKNRDKPLKDRAQRTTSAAARRHLVPALKAQAPRGASRSRQSYGLRIIGGRKRRRRMSTSATAKLLRKRAGEDIRPTWAGYKAFHARFYIEGTAAHSLATRGLLAGERGRFTKMGTWRSGFAHFADGEVRPLAGITVRGVTPHPIVDRAWDSVRRRVFDDIKRDVFEVR